MKLKEKFTTMVLDKDIAEWEKECEVIADEFAIGFATWVRASKIKQRPYDFDNIEQLLEIYKKEKGL